MPFHHRLARRLALLAVILVTAWVFAPKPERPPVGFTTPPPVPAVSPGGTTPAPGTATPLTTTTATKAPPVSATAGRPATPLVAPAEPSSSLPGTAPAVPAADVTPPVSATAATAVAVDQVRLMLRDYRTLTGENPVGTNAEIMRALMGDNPRQARLGPPEGQTLNDDGELVDRWGTPLFFHQLSKTVMEIRSAGPDKIMWTEDDIVAQ